MRDIWKPLEKSWMAKLALLSYGGIFLAMLMHWTKVEYVAAILFVLSCLVIGETQIKILKDHIEKLEDRMDILEARTKHTTESL
jgi:hypothetical protein